MSSPAFPRQWHLNGSPADRPLIPAAHCPPSTLHPCARPPACLPACLQEVYGSATKSNNNSWLRRKLYEAVGVAPLKANTKGKARKPAASAASRKSSSAAPKEAAAKPRWGGGGAAGEGGQPVCRLA